MSRLVVFGCSLAYGVGLVDCWPTPLKPSKLSWPQLTATAMGRTLVNKSFPGASNKRIWYSIKKFKFKSDDLVIISWTFPNRYSVITSPWNTNDLHHNHSEIDAASKSYYTDIYSTYDSYVMSNLFVDHANKILQGLNIKVYNLVVEQYFKHIIGKHELIPMYIGVYEESYPKALDNDHLGQEGHVAFASDLMDYFGEAHTLVAIKPYNIFKQLKHLIWK